jgi:hypothetical protein
VAHLDGKQSALLDLSGVEIHSVDSGSLVHEIHEGGIVHSLDLILGPVLRIEKVKKEEGQLVSMVVLV